jgi:hypothetical protein
LNSATQILTYCTLTRTQQIREKSLEVKIDQLCTVHCTLYSVLCTLYAYLTPIRAAKSFCRILLFWTSFLTISRNFSSCGCGCTNREKKYNKIHSKRKKKEQKCYNSNRSYSYFATVFPSWRETRPTTTLDDNWIFVALVWWIIGCVGTVWKLSGCCWCCCCRRT